MIFSEQGFKGHLSKLAQHSDGEETVVKFSLKHSEDHPDFLQGINDIFETNNISTFADAPSKLKIALDLNLPLVVKFDQVEFDAVLIGVGLSKKESNKGIVFNYEMKFEKELEKEMDSVLGVNYLKRKEENAKGKMELVSYTISLKKQEDK